ncbi:MAG: hypothetical protein KKD48_05490, partial [Nanoarchaeota archaeon]|nr:hypothetical protein [Nanoarchaeota archaeon]
RSLSSEQIKFLYENRTDILSSSETSFDEYWHASVTPVDSTQEKGEQVNSSYLKINHLAPFFYNITFFDNLTSISNKTGIIFNGSATLGDLEDGKLNMSFTWYENGVVLISNNTIASNMSNITNGINGTMYYTTQNLTNLHYRSGYNYTLGVYACNGYFCVQGNSTLLFVNNIQLEKLNYLGKARAFSVGFDDMMFAVQEISSVGYKFYYDGLIDFFDLYDKTNGTKYSWDLIPKDSTDNPSVKNGSNLTDPNYNFRWNMADAEYDKRIAICLHGWNHTVYNEYVSGTSEIANYSTEYAFNLYNEVIGRNATCWKFPGYKEGGFGFDSLLYFPYVLYIKNTNLHNINKTDSRISAGDDMGTNVPNSFANNYFVSGHFASNVSTNRDNLNRTKYFDDLLTLINYAEGQQNVSYEDSSELGEIFDMYTSTILAVLNETAFRINSDDTYWTYRKRLAINLTYILDDATNPYVQITTPSGMKVSQNMTTYTGTGANRAALVIIPVENGTYTITNLTTQPTDPSFTIQNFTVFANNTKWSFNSTDANASAYAIFKIVWTGDSNVWGNYNNTNTDFNITHGFMFNQSQGDNWWVEHDMKTGKLHILGASGPGTEYITAQMPFVFTRTVNDASLKRYIINPTAIFKNIIANFNLSIPESYDNSWKLNITFANGTVINNTKFYQSGSII